MNWQKIGKTHRRVEVKPDTGNEMARQKTGWQKIGMVRMKVEAKPSTSLAEIKLEAQINDYGKRFRVMIMDSSGKSAIKDLPSLRKAKAWADRKIREAIDKGWAL